MLWQVDREAALFLGAGRALLLQLAHPWVAAGIAQHSTTLANPIDRFHRTFATMFTLVFGSLEQSLAAARHLHRRHAVVQGSLRAPTGRFKEGSAYHANEATALMWVHATLVETAVIAHDLVLPPLSPEERERYYQECRLLGSMFGLSEENQPQDWSGFMAYCSSMWSSDTLSVTPEARLIAEQVLQGAGSWLRAPGWYHELTAHLLPEPVRESYGLPYGQDEKRRAQRALRWMPRAYPLLPARLRYVGPYQEAVGRLRGRARPTPLVRSLNKLWIGRRSMGP
jgi:uncharacterized protein (DUF2236 family)